CHFTRARPCQPWAQHAFRSGPAALNSMKAGVLAAKLETLATDGGCCTKPSAKTWAARAVTAADGPESVEAGQGSPRPSHEASSVSTPPLERLHRARRGFVQQPRRVAQQTPGPSAQKHPIPRTGAGDGIPMARTRWSRLSKALLQGSQFAPIAGPV